MKVSVPAVAPPTPPRDRRVERQHARLRARLVRALGAVDVDRRAIDDERALAAPRRGTPTSLRARGVRPAAWSRPRRLAATASRAPAAIVTPAAAAAASLRLDEVEALNRMARLDEIGGHRRAHVAETEKCDFGHVHFPWRSILDQAARHDHPHDLVRSLENLVHAQGRAPASRRRNRRDSHSRRTVAARRWRR